MSHARRRFQNISAAVAAAAVSGPTMTMDGANAYELQLAQLNQDRLRLKQVQSEQGKAELKRSLIPAYAPYIEGVLSAGNGAQDDVLTTLMVWNIDAGDFAAALNIGRYVLEHKLKMPDRFARTTGCLLAEEVANAALKQQKAGEPFNRFVLTLAADITAEHDMPDEARAKLHLALGKAYLADLDEAAIDGEQLEQARANLARAIDLHSNCGGKKDMERVVRLQKKHAESKPAGTGTGDPTEPEHPTSDQDESQPSEEGAPSTEPGTGEPPAD
ncbi:terminase [Pseudomonas sp. Choline-3u-10]|nr:terminase [Pseudomonas sp. Choline-3u-10]